MKRTLMTTWVTTTLLLVAFFLVGTVAEAATPLSQRIEKKRFQTKEWNDGKAEVSLYRAREILMRKARASEVIILFEKRSTDENDEKGKKKSRGKSKELISMSLIRDTNVGMSTIHSNHLVEALIPDLRLNRLVLDNQQWGEVSLRVLDYRLQGGGKAFGRFLDFPRKAKKSRDHFFNLGSLVKAVPYDALPLVLRAIDFSKGGFNFLVIEPLDNPAVQEPRMGPAELVVAPEETLFLTGQPYQVRPVVVSHFLGEDRFWFNVKSPYLLVKWIRYNGAEYTLRRSKRLDYWNKTQPIDSTLLE